MRSPPCLLLLLQALALALAGTLPRWPEHQQVQDDQVFLDTSTAHTFLRRKLLYNHWDFELIVPDNLERECREEVCNYEEAREVFEDDGKTAEASAGGIDAEFAAGAKQALHQCLQSEHPRSTCSLKDFWETYVHNGKGGARTPGVDVAGLVAGLVAALVSAIMFVVVAMYCFKYRNKGRSRSSMTQDSFNPGVPLSSFDEVPKPESAPGLPSYEQAMEASGMHDAPPPPYNRNTIH